MTTFFERYRRGECEQVWHDLLKLGTQVREEPYYSDAIEVARETMRRARHNIELIIERLRDIGYLFGYDWAAPEHAERIAEEPPLLFQNPQTDRTNEDVPNRPAPALDIQQRIESLEAVGALLPLSLRAFYEIVGAVNFVGVSTPAMDRFEFGDDATEDENADEEDMLDEELDPLYIRGIDKTFTPEAFQVWQQEKEGKYTLVVSYDAASKYFLSEFELASSLLIEVPCAEADVFLLSKDGYGQTFVEYVRYNIQRGGLPGLPEFPGLGEKALAYVTRDLLPM